jgi:uncharacterized protein involved in outer membrane biogenesis
LKTLKIIIAVLVVLVALRLAMPYVLLRYVENRINQIPEYHVTIADLDIHLYRGSYTLKDIKLVKINKKIPVPFFSANLVDLSVQWRALLRGAFVGELMIDHPEVNFVIDPKGQNQQLTINEQWQEAVKALFPLNFNKIIVRNGILHFRSFTSQPPFDLFLKNANAEVNNLHGVERNSGQLPSSLVFKAKSMDGAPININMKFDPFARQPKFTLNAVLEGMDIKEANNFLHHYTLIDVKQGKFSLYAEVAAKDGKITGYAKPIIKNLKVIEANKNMSPVEALYKGALQIVTKVLENPSTKTVATRVVISGNIENPNTSLWSIMGNLLSHAFLQALLPQLDHTIKMRDVELN